MSNGTYPKPRIMGTAVAAGWSVVGSTEAWLRVLDGGLNMSTALRRNELRYCDSATGGCGRSASRRRRARSSSAPSARCRTPSAKRTLRASPTGGREDPAAGREMAERRSPGDGQWSDSGEGTSRGLAGLVGPDGPVLGIALPAQAQDRGGLVVPRAPASP
jgi:hypothetical protein